MALAIPELPLEPFRDFAQKFRDRLIPYYATFFLDNFQRFIYDDDDLVEGMVATYYGFCEEEQKLIPLAIFFTALEVELNGKRSVYQGRYRHNDQNPRTN